MIEMLFTLWLLRRFTGAIVLLFIAAVALVICADKQAPADKPIHRRVEHHRHER